MPGHAELATGRPSRIRRVLRTILWALVFAFAIGFLIGTLVRRVLERPVRYIGARPSPASILVAAPGDVGHALSHVLMPSHHEEQV